MAALILTYELKGKARTRPDILGWFWVCVHNVAHVRPRSKNRAKNQFLHMSSFDLSRKKKQF